MNNLQIIEHEGIRVLTTQQLSEVYETSTENIKQNFKRNKERFNEGRDYYLLKGAYAINNIFGVVLASIMIYFCISTKALKVEGLKVVKYIIKDDIEGARKQLSYIVGRDTENLSEKEIIRATVETVAENTVDGLIAPLFYAFVGACINVGGISLAAPLAMTYKAINTLDSSVGYKNEKYLHIGFASAKIDDIANYIPSRISVILFTIGNLFLRNDYKNCFKISIRDRKNHKSPNCAFSEGAVAGALGIQLGGTNIYFGETVYKPTIGDKTREIEVQDISRTNKILYATSLTSMLVFTLFYVIIYHIFM